MRRLQLPQFCRGLLKEKLNGTEGLHKEKRNVKSSHDFYNYLLYLNIVS